MRNTKAYLMLRYARDSILQYGLTQTLETPSDKRPCSVLYPPKHTKYYKIPTEFQV